MTDIKDFIDTIILGDALEVPKTFPDNSIDTIITDPPYGLEFMGKEWDKFGVTEGRAKRLLGIDNKGTGDKFFDYREGASERGRYSELTIKEKSAFQEFIYQWAKECLRVAKPGTILLCFGGTRTWHRLACAIEDAGWIIKDTLMWLYGSGFPKSLNIGKAVDKLGENPLGWVEFSKTYKKIVEESKYTHNDIDKYLGIKASSSYWARTDERGGLPPRHHWEKIKELLKIDGRYDKLYDEIEREVIGLQKNAMSGWNMNGTTQFKDRDITKGTSEWEDYGTALKPAYEPIIMAMKPLDGTFAENALKWGVSGLNIDEGRIGYKSEKDRIEGQSARPSLTKDTIFPIGGFDRSERSNIQGRFPANLLLDEVSAEMLDEQSGINKSSKFISKTTVGKRENTYNQDIFDYSGKGYEDVGGASRFFYVAKASKSERNAGLEDLPIKDPDDRDDIGKGSYTEKGIAPQQNFHPTVKPIKLMEYLVKLTKMPNPNQVYLDPFAGSGSTLIAVLNNDRHFIGIDKEKDYVEIAKARIKYWSERKDKTLDFGEK